MSNVAVLRAFLRRDWQIAISYRLAFGLQLGRVFLTLALFFYLGRIVDPTALPAGQDLSGGYFGYVAVGLALFEIAQIGLSSFSRKLREEQMTGTLEAMLVTPTSHSVIILSSAAYDLLRAMVDGLILIAAAVLIFGLTIETDPGSLAAAFAALAGCIGLFVSLGVALAAFTIVFKRALGMLSLVILALGLLGGVYFPVEVLPAPIEAIANILPFTWALDVARAGLLGGEVDPGQLARLYGSVAVLLPAALLVFRASVWRSRRLGTLAQY